MSSVEEDDSGSEVNSGQEISCELVVACGDGAKVLEFVEETLDEMAFTIEREVAIPRRFAIGFWRNRRGDFSLSESVNQRIGVVSLVAKQGLRISAVDQLLRASQIVGLSWREDQLTGLPKASTSAWILVVSPPRDRPIACSPFFFAHRHCADARARSWHQSSCIRCHGRSPTA